MITLWNNNAAVVSVEVESACMTFVFKWCWFCSGCNKTLKTRNLNCLYADIMYCIPSYASLAICMHQHELAISQQMTWLCSTTDSVRGSLCIVWDSLRHKQTQMTSYSYYRLHSFMHEKYPAQVRTLSHYLFMATMHYQYLASYMSTSHKILRTCLGQFGPAF